MAERKKFIDVEVPILNQTIQALGSVKELTGKTIRLDLSRKLRGKGAMMTLELFEYEGGLIAAPKRFEILGSYLRKVTRKRTDIVEDSFIAQTSDLAVRMKPFLITRNKVSRAVRRNLRSTARDFLLSYVKEKSYMDLSREILDGSLQRTLLPKLKKVYPLAFCDIRVFSTTELANIDLATVAAIHDSEENEEDIDSEAEEESSDDEGTEQVDEDSNEEEEADDAKQE